MEPSSEDDEIYAKCLGNLCQLKDSIHLEFRTFWKRCWERPGNEAARQFVFRVEFEQMEMQYFVEHGTDSNAYGLWKKKRLSWHKSIGIREENLRFSDHPKDKLAHYALAAVDVQYKFPIGWQEVEGIHNRSDFDLTQHQKFSGKKLDYFDQKSNKRYVPYVIETSIGLDRCTLMVLCDAYREEEVNGEKRTVLKMHPKLAPIQVGVFPWLKNLASGSRPKIESGLSEDSLCVMMKRVQLVSATAIGEAGTPFCITVISTPGVITVTIRQ